MRLPLPASTTHRETFYPAAVPKREHASEKPDEGCEGRKTDTLCSETVQVLPLQELVRVLGQMLFLL